MVEMILYASPDEGSSRSEGAIGVVDDAGTTSNGMSALSVRDAAHRDVIHSSLIGDNMLLLLIHSKCSLDLTTTPCSEA